MTVRQAVRKVVCTTCKARRGRECVTRDGVATKPHVARYRRSIKRELGRLDKVLAPWR